MAPLTRSCPYCEKEIPIAQIVCQHCGKQPEQFWKLNGRMWIVMGAALALILGFALLRPHL